jgi:hypothetical protein
MLAIRTLGQYGQVRHRQHRAIQRERQALHHADGDTHAGECARSATESDGVDRLQRGPASASNCWIIGNSFCACRRGITS